MLFDLDLKVPGGLGLRDLPHDPGSEGGGLDPELQAIFS